MELRKALIESLQRLKNDFGAVSIKAEFEVEGSRKDELIMLREYVENVGMRLIIKIGGCEAIHDIDQCKLLDADGIMAPMIETAFAMDKFRGAVTKVCGADTQMERIINAETITCLDNFDEILSHGWNFLTGVTVGRSDLAASMGVPRAEIEGKAVFEATKAFCTKAQNAGLTTNFGGNIGIQSVPFILSIGDFIDRFETRKVIMEKNGNAEFLKAAIAHALKFELLYLQMKSQYYSSMAMEDSMRISRLSEQLNSVDMV